MISTAAAVALLLIVGGLYLFNKNHYPEQYNTILVPPGQRINLILADNSNVWLNANTTLRYPTQFSKKNRTVYIDGEGYFEVSKNKKRPFIDKTNLGCMCRLQEQLLTLKRIQNTIASKPAFLQAVWIFTEMRLNLHH